MSNTEYSDWSMDYESEGSFYAPSSEHGSFSEENTDNAGMAALTLKRRKTKKMKKTHHNGNVKDSAYPSKSNSLSRSAPNETGHFSRGFSDSNENTSISAWSIKQKSASVRHSSKNYAAATVTHVPRTRDPISTPSRKKSIETRLSALEQNLEEIKANQAEIIRLQKETLSKLCTSDDRNKIDGKRTKKSVPVSSTVRAVVRDGHKNGEDTGLAWILSKENAVMRPESEENKEITKYIKTFVLGILPQTGDAVIKAATLRYFQSLKEKRQRQTSGKTTNFNKNMVLYQRKKRKLTARRSAVGKKTSWTKKTKEKVLEALKMDYMSSEVEDDSDGEPVFVTKSLNWRSDELSNYIDELDKKNESCRSKRGTRQHTKRVKGTEVSIRMPPDVEEPLRSTLKKD